MITTDGGTSETLVNNENCGPQPNSLVDNNNFNNVEAEGESLRTCT